MALWGLLCASGCQWAVDDADSDVYRLIENRQRATIARTTDTDVGRERWPDWDKPSEPGPDEKYDFVPHRVDGQVPPAFRGPTSAPEGRTGADLTGPSARLRAVGSSQPAAVGATTQPAVSDDRQVGSSGTPASQPFSAAITTQPAEPLRVMSLSDVVQYAFSHARDFQSAKEDLYLSALALTLERHLWTPLLVSNIQTRYANYGAIRDFDQAMAVVAETAVEQKLPYGGQLTATVINSLMRDLTNHLTSGETGKIVLAADIPLLRGAGPAAYESRYQAERDLIYAVRTFERFRQTFAVDIAGSYFDLQQRKQQIYNLGESIKSFTSEVDRARARWQTGRIIELDVQRAEQDRLSVVNRRLIAINSYRTAMETFKIRLGMPPEEEFDVDPLGGPEEDLNAGGARLTDARIERTIRMPQVSLTDAVKVGHQYRLDLLNVLDRIDDRRRGVDIAENNLLPSLDAQGSVTYDTNPDRLNMADYHDDRATWRSALNLEVPLDRVEERNALRGALINKERAVRNYSQSRDQVAAQISQTMRQVLLSQQSLRIQILSRDLALKRREGARIRFEQGRVSNREVVDAENSLLNARDALAAAQVQLRLAILQFFRDTGMLRLNDEGRRID
jgi:outer membrane protein TolC